VVGPHLRHKVSRSQKHVNDEPNLEAELPDEGPHGILTKDTHVRPCFREHLARFGVRYTEEEARAEDA
jgi:hypothetical protein